MRRRFKSSAICICIRPNVWTRIHCTMVSTDSMSRAAQIRRLAASCLRDAAGLQAQWARFSCIWRRRLASCSRRLRQNATRPSSGYSLQMSGIGPTFGQLGYFHKFAGREIDDKRPLERFRSEAQRLLGVLEQRLEDREWLMGDIYTIADISLIGWVRSLTALIDA